MSADAAPSNASHDSSLPRTQSRPANIALWVVQVLAAAGFLMAAVSKITGVPAAVATFDAIGFGDWFRYLIAVLEIAGAVALLVPLLSGLAGLAFVGLMIGAIAIHFFVLGAGAAMPAVYLVLVAVIAWGRRRRTAELVNMARRTT